MKILILAGGRGERFWPLSTERKPKQFLSLVTDKSMIRETLDRVLRFVEYKDIFIATNEEQFQKITDELPDVPINNIILEPSYKDTAAAIAYGSMIIAKSCKSDPIICVLASDHSISNVDEFIKSLKIAENRASKGNIVTLGIKPSRAETGYGYIELPEIKIGKEFKVLSFLEKPNFARALEYVKQGNYVWNSGIFIFKFSILLEEFKRYLFNHYSLLMQISSKIINQTGKKLAIIAKPFFIKMEKISIDYGIMEKSKIIECIPVDIGWDDLGSFISLENILDKDDNDNAIKNAKFIQLNSNKNIILSTDDNLLIASIGITDLIIVYTKEALLICSKNDSQKIKELIKKIK